MSDLLAACHWPPMAEPFRSALRDAVTFAIDEADPVGIIATGTIVRGEAHPGSDIDLYVIRVGSTRRRVQRFFHGVPTEIFINPVAAIHSYLPEEHRAGRRFTAHMVATGFVVLDRDPVVEQLRAECRDWLAKPDELSASAAVRARYAAASHVEDGADLTPVDPTGAALILARSVSQMLELWLRASGRPIPRAKEIVREVRTLDPELGALVDRFVAATSAADRLATGQAIADRTVGTRGFFEWDSGEEPVPGSAS